MPTRDDIDELAAARKTILEAAAGQVDTIWDSRPKNMTNAEFVAVLERDIPQLLHDYVDTIATVAADWYEHQRDAEVSAREIEYFRAALADYPHPRAVKDSIRSSCRHLFSKNPQPEVALQELKSNIAKHLIQSERQTITRNVAADKQKPRFALVPVPPMTCAWCTLLASRGWVYRDHDDAFMSTHDGCDCSIVPAWGNIAPRIPGYDPDSYYDMYQTAVRRVKNGTEKEIAAKMRSLYPGAFTDGHKVKTPGAFRDTGISKHDWAKNRRAIAKYAKQLAASRGETAANYLLPPLEPTPLPFPWDENKYFHFNAWKFNHILYGDMKGGGHLHKYNWREGKTAFPEDWTPTDVALAIQSVVEQQKKATPQNLRFLEGSYEGVKIKVILNKSIDSADAEIISAYRITLE
ncbi:EndoU domain-containing protein [Canibacter oris]|uniref:Bacterial EndoU nuclease domain-containing protein n=1 Tax=Canibacter oris TaxID=1365628 RepID=A0A840DNH0_9MICO|nr:EndoU domain-containing protein [Canibacter oris]MBB4071617.1 hypothetical protein [Canibacter oris]